LPESPVACPPEASLSPGLKEQIRELVAHRLCCPDQLRCFCMTAGNVIANTPELKPMDKIETFTWLTKKQFV
jgi:hypothetical protein